MVRQVTKLTSGQLAQLVEMNLANVPAVNEITADEFRGFADRAEFFGVVELEKTLAGFMVALASGHDYDSPNYRYFLQNLQGFLYVDRIVVNDKFRRRGFGQLMYQSLERFALEQSFENLCCEVNLRPSNTGSMLFHRRLGFQQVATQVTENGSKEVALLVKRLVGR